MKHTLYNLYLRIIIIRMHEAASREQEYWSGLPFPPSGNLPNSGIKPVSGGFLTTSTAWEAPGAY